MALTWAATTILALTLYCLLILTNWKWRNRRAKLPPGPRPLPLLGNLLQLGAGSMVQSFQKLREKYGPVFTVYMGPRLVVVLHGHEAVKEALVGQADDFSGRGEMALLNETFQGHGIAFANGERWKVLQRFTLTALRDCGMGKQSNEKRIQEEAGFLLEEFRKTKGASFNPIFFLYRSVCNVISSMIFGSRFDYEDKEFLKLLKIVNENISDLNQPWAQLYDMYSGVMQYLPGKHRSFYYRMKEIEDFILSQVKVHEASLDPQNPQNFIDYILIKKNQEKDNPHTEFHLKNLVGTALNIFIAGTESVSTTLYYGLMLLLKYPEVQVKMQEEINQVIGPHRIPRVDDRVQMPYTEAVIHEVLRTKGAPFGLPHCVTRDTQFRGYLLPKGTNVFPLLGSALRDPKYFRYPDAFYPEHFLDEQGRFKKNEAFVAFSSGKRVCPGMAMVHMELFLYFTTILQSFSLHSEVPLKEEELELFSSGITNIIPTYELCLVDCGTPTTSEA